MCKTKLHPLNMDLNYISGDSKNFVQSVPIPL